MKKRKPPIVLATCLVLMLLAVGIMYSPGRAAAGGDGHGHEEPAPPPAAEQGERPKLSPTQVSSMASGAMTPAAKGGRPKGPEAPGGPSDKPSIAIPKAQPYKPTPNESSTSTQWYTDQTKK